MERQPGFYWVKDFNGEWTIAEYKQSYDDGGKGEYSWFMAGDGFTWNDADFEQIDEDIIERKKSL